MRKYAYEARDKVTNKVEKGEVQADSEYLAGRAFIDQGFIPVKDL